MNPVRVLGRHRFNHAHYGPKACRSRSILGPLWLPHRGLGVQPKSAEETSNLGKVTAEYACEVTINTPRVIAEQNAEAATTPLLLLVDGHSLAFRCYYAFRRNGEGLCTSSQIPTSVTHGFLKCLLEYSCAMKPQGVVIAFDSLEPCFRQKHDVRYKANRDVATEEFCKDLNNLQGILRNALRIPIFESPGFEADDVLGTLANKAADDGWRVRILSGDQDLFQLVDDTRDIGCLYMKPKSHINQYENSVCFMDNAAVLAKLGVAPSSIVDFKALAGDSSDNFPGVRGIGPKTASALLQQHKTLDGIYASLGQLPEIGPSVKKKLYDDREAAYRCQFLAKIKVDVPLDSPISWELGRVDLETLARNLQELQLKYLQGRFCDLINIFSNNGQRHESNVVDAIQTWTSIKKEHLAKFNRNLGLLVTFRKREGHSNVPRAHVEDRVNLGMWLHCQRQMYRNGRLDEGRRLWLEEVGVVWDVRRSVSDANFKFKLGLLVTFRAREGHNNVPYNHTEDGVALGRWLDNQRHMYRSGRLHADRQVQLEEVGVMWDMCGNSLHDANFNSKLGLLLLFRQRERHSNVPHKHVENGVYLGHWLYAQRRSYRKGLLHAARQAQLEEAGVLWDPPKSFSANFNLKLQLLLAFRRREGHSNVPCEHIENGVNLGRWLSEQRQQFQKGLLEKARQVQLEHAGVTWDLCRTN